MLCFVWREDNIDLFWTLEYQIRLLWTQMRCYQPPQSVEQPILPSLTRLSFHGVSVMIIRRCVNRRTAGGRISTPPPPQVFRK